MHVSKISHSSPSALVFTAVADPRNATTALTKFERPSDGEKMIIGDEQGSARLTIASAMRARRTRLFRAALIAGSLTGLSSQHAAATPAYATQTGKPCGYCHVSASGGGALTAEGKEFAKGKHMFLINFAMPVRSASTRSPRTGISAP